MPQTLSSSNEFAMQVVQIGTTDIAEFDAFKVIPDLIIWIEIRGIAGKLFQPQALSGNR